MNRSGINTEERTNIAPVKLYREIAVLLEAIENCKQYNNLDWAQRHSDLVIALVLEYMPSGSGIDNGVTIDFEVSDSKELVFNFGYHAMNEVGMYTGWYDCYARVRSNLAHELDLRIVVKDGGKQAVSLRENLRELFADALMTEVTHENLTRLSNK